MKYEYFSYIVISETLCGETKHLISGWAEFWMCLSQRGVMSPKGEMSWLFLFQKPYMETASTLCFDGAVISKAISHTAFE
jgi:hypothetical protein